MSYGKDGKGTGICFSNSESQRTDDIKEVMRRINLGIDDKPEYVNFNIGEVMGRYDFLIDSLEGGRVSNCTELGRLKNLVDYMQMSPQTRYVFSTEIKNLNRIIGSYAKR